MTDQKVWFITGAGRGMGIDVAKAALAAGNAVVATARKTNTVTAALGRNDDLLAVKLDVTDPSDAEVAVQSAVDRFGHMACWSTTRATSTPDSSRRSAPRTSGRRSRPRCSARSTSLVRSCR